MNNQAVAPSLSRTAGRLTQDGIGSALLQLLSPADFDCVAPYLERVMLKKDTVLCRAGEPILQLCFPEAGVIGFADVLADGQRLVVALTGFEGLVGWPLVLGNDRWPHEAIVRAESGTALTITAANLLSIMAGNERIRTMLLRYASSLTAQMARTIVSNLIHSVEERTARWILLYHDRISGDALAITHEELGVMLGVRRSSITDALHKLEGAGAIRGHRGRLIVQNRQCLIGLAGEAYGFAEAEYERLVGPIAPRR